MTSVRKYGVASIRSLPPSSARTSNEATVDVANDSVTERADAGGQRWEIEEVLAQAAGWNLEQEPALGGVPVQRKVAIVFLERPRVFGDGLLSGDRKAHRGEHGQRGKRQYGGTGHADPRVRGGGENVVR